MQVVSFAACDMPVIKESPGKDWVSFGERNDYPQLLLKMTTQSPIHNAIVFQKSLMVAGSGFSVDGVSIEALRKEQYTSAEQEVQNFLSNAGDDLHQVVGKVAMDYEVFGAYAMEAVWSLDFTKVVMLKHVDVSKVRVGKRDSEGNVNYYYYSEDWTRTGQNPVHTIQAFSKKKYEGKDYNQLIYVKNHKPGFDHYGVPSYYDCLNAIQTDVQLGIFFLATVNNGFNPSMMVKFFEKPGSAEEKHDIYNSIKRQFGGVKNSGKALVFFSDGKDLSPDVQPIATQNLDKQYITAADQAVNRILSGHRVTSPELMGVSIPGKLGTGDLETSYKIFNATVIRPDKNTIENTINEIAEINGIKQKIGIMEFNPLA